MQTKPKKEGLSITILLIITLTLFFLNIYEFYDYNLITGKAVDTAWGSANVTISGLTQINVSAGLSNNTNITFGSGYVLPGYTYCSMASDSTLHKSSGCSSGLASPGANFTIENSGNKNLTINISADTNALGFIGGTGPVFNYQVGPTTEAGCTGTIPAAVDWFPFNTSTNQICSILDSTATKDTMQVAINISIPDNSRTGALGSIITFTGMSA